MGFQVLHAAALQLEDFSNPGAITMSRPRRFRNCGRSFLVKDCGGRGGFGYLRLVMRGFGCALDDD